MLNYQRVCSPTVHAIARLGAPSIPTPSYGRRGRILGPQQLLSLHLQRVAVQGQDGAFRQAALLAHKGDRPFETEKDHGDSWGIENWDYSHIYIYTYMIIHNYIIINYSICITYIITYIYIWFELIWDHQICHILCCFISRWNHCVRPWRPRLAWHRRPEFVPKNAILIDGLWCLSIGLWWLMLVKKMVRKKSKSWLSL